MSMALAISGQGSPNSAFFAGSEAMRLAHLVFFGGFLGHDGFVDQAGLIALDGLERIFDAENVFLRRCGHFPRSSALNFLSTRVAARPAIRAPADRRRRARNSSCDMVFRRPVDAGIAGDEDQVAFLHAARWTI